MRRTYVDFVGDYYDNQDKFNEFDEENDIGEEKETEINFL